MDGFLSGWVAGVMLGGYVVGAKLPSWVGGWVPGAMLGGWVEG